MKDTIEINFDGLVGPTHNFAGLSHGNVASKKSADQVSNPQAAALQGLQKMQSLSKMGLMQGILPPHERPHIPTLKVLGFSGTDTEILEKVQQTAPHILASVSSASSMWVANAATVSAAPDTADRKTHFTPANLSSMFHRSIEHPVTGRILKRIFENDTYFVHHNALPAGEHFKDEGAANHTRLCQRHGSKGVEIFVYGTSAFDSSYSSPQKFPARQSIEASRAIARLHGLDDQTCIFAQQNPAVIDAGVFHNDVIAVGNENCFFYHQDAFVNATQLQKEVRTKLDNENIFFIEVPRSSVSVTDAVTSYLFNTQLVRDAEDGGMGLIAPLECKENMRVRAYLDKLILQDTPIKRISYLDVRQSMKNGGGPACLRLRVPLAQEAINSIKSNVFITDTLFADLTAWIKQHYRDELRPADLADPNLLSESRTALDELTNILKLGSVYDFQAG